MKPIVIMADSRHYGTCRSCGARIEWATVFASQSQMPFDPPIVLVPSLAFDNQPPSVVRVDMTKTASHFATCPQAASWRRRAR